MNLTKQEALKKIEELKEYVETKDKQTKPWRAEIAKEYWYGNNMDTVYRSVEENNQFDNCRYLIGNYFQTKEEVQVHLDRQKALGRVTHAILKANDGWEPDWENIDESKYYIYYCHNSGVFRVDCYRGNHSYILLPFIKSIEIAHQIIKDHKEDLPVIFRVK